MQTTRVFERILSMAQMHQIGVLHRGPEMLWTCRWNEAGRVSTIHYQLEQDPKNGSLAFRLRYRIPGVANETVATLDYTVAVRTSLSIKGKTWYWFVCPLVVNGQPCRRRARNLHFLPSSPYFGCQHCRELMARSLPAEKRLILVPTEAGPPPGEAVPAAEGTPDAAGERTSVWHPDKARSACHHCGCLSEGAFCCNCGEPMAEGRGIDYFELLGVAPQASSRDIRVAFVSRTKEYHPDLVAHLGKKLQQAAEDEFKRINLAYEVLKDPESRLDYLRALGKA